MKEQIKNPIDTRSIYDDFVLEYVTVDDEVEAMCDLGVHLRYEDAEQFW